MKLQSTMDWPRIVSRYTDSLEDIPKLPLWCEMLVAQNIISMRLTSALSPPKYESADKTG
jgi:hypothetical protein